MRVLIIRHGATAGNAQSRYVGRRTDEPLSEEGRAQCLRTGVYPQVKKVYASPMLRAVQTAELCFPQARVQMASGLEEFDFGAFEGRSAHEMEDDTAYRAWVDSGCVAACPGGESREAYVARSNAALTSVLQQAAREHEEHVVIVAHGGTIMAAFSAFAAGDSGCAIGEDSYFRWHVGTCEGYEAEVCFDGETFALVHPHHVTQMPDWLGPRK